MRATVSAEEVFEVQPDHEEPAELYREEILATNRESFAAFRRAIRPHMIWGWWVQEVANHFQQFYYDMIAGRRPKLALMAPPQHGKSWSVTDFMAYVAGRRPDKKIIFASFSDELGIRTNVDLQRLLSSDNYKTIFPKTQIEDANVVTLSDRWKRNSSLIEFIGQRGSFRNTTVAGQINGQELHLGVIDDPLKGRAEANSKLIRDKTWDWFSDDFMSRFAKDGALLIIMTRWHVDDILGRFCERFKDVKVLRYPAIAEHDEQHRRKGDPLFPEHKPMDFLMERRAMLTQAAWESIYQQHPIIVGGGQLPVDRLKVLRAAVDRSKVQHSVRYVDKAATEDGGAYTAAVLMHAMIDKTFVISHIARGQWAVLERETRLKQLAQADRAEWKSYEIIVEQEPGSGGKESVEATIRNLAGFTVSADKVTGDKEVRAEPFAAQVQGGNVSLIAGQWVLPFLEECETWPNGKYMDQVDAAAGAFNKLVSATSYNTNYKAWI